VADEEGEPAAAAGADEGDGAAEVPRVRLEIFEGPLDLLLHLIKRNEVEITDIPIASITAQYLAYIDLIRDLNLDLAGEFLVMASTLTLIKSRLLLPADAAGEEELEDDPRTDLVRQLLEYQRYREVAASIADRPQLNRDVFAREPLWDGDQPLVPEPPPIQVSVWDLIDAYRRVLERARPASVHEVQIERVSLREKVQFVLARLSVSRSVDFEALFPEEATKLEVIVTFLAVLELMKLRAIEAYQADQFGAIVIALAVSDASAVSIDLLDEYESQPAKEEEG
jgi:segregation and condensation protein A